MGGTGSKANTAGYENETGNTFQGAHDMAKHYFMVVISGLFLLAIVILFVNNAGNTCENLHFYWTTLNGQSVGLIMLVSAGVGVITWKMLRIFGKNSWRIYRGRKQRQKENRPAKQPADVNEQKDFDGGRT